jgi:putative phosphonate metabolism protein
MTARYAIYYAPRRDSLLHDLASAWLGRDAYTGEAVARPSVPGLEGLDLDALTADPRGYGFHATLKAPFELAADTQERDLVDFAERFAAARPAFSAAIAPASLGRFLAFRLTAPTPAMDALHAACVRDFDRFRAPIGEFDLARRRKADLSPEQDARLVAWGYPYIFEEFRFHMTLTGAVRDREIASRLLDALGAHFAEVAGEHRFDGVAVFRQPDRSAPFHILARFDFAADISDMAASAGAAAG